MLPTEQTCTNSRLHYVGALAEVPDLPPIEEVAPDLAQRIRATNHQHPDHDTTDWVPRYV